MFFRLRDMKFILLFITVLFALSACGEDRASGIKSKSSVQGVRAEGDSDRNDFNREEICANYDTNISNIDTDGDGITDREEICTYNTDPTNADSDGDGISDKEEIFTYDTNATNADTDGDSIKDGKEIILYLTDPKNEDSDGDGLKDGDEINIYDTNATNADTDGDGLTDREEIISYFTNPKNSDSDNDGLSDYIEVNRDDLNATNPDTDGDCLLDGFEVLNYETNASKKDTDGDGVDDGIEIYSYAIGEFNTTCLTTPETKENGFNPTPAIDAIPNIKSDIINALDPTNDSDGDGQVNQKENSCANGNPLDSSTHCPFITDSKEAKILEEHGYAYVPGGFDVDGDGIKEAGFWISRYQARSTGIVIPSEIVIEKVGNVNQYISANFKVLNKNIKLTSYDEKHLSETIALAGNELIFDEDSIAGQKRISHMTPYLALVCLHEYKLKDKNNNTELDLNITMPSLKQYMQVKQLLDADSVNNGDGRHIRNGLLGIDPEIPLYTYSLVIDEFGKEHKEYLRNLVQLRDTFGHYTFDIDKIPDWWDVDLSLLEFLIDGSHSTQDLGHGIGPDKDPYGVIVRGGTILNVSEGVAGALTDDEGKNNGISFRAATPYLK
ncbi:MAG: hypothetical protein DSZ07_03690 [Sulfurovum sp.]|nr:MAG: hypothetical protein DSZ07_03690 [Sulfurovum sp.]